MEGNAILEEAWYVVVTLLTRLVWSMDSHTHIEAKHKELHIITESETSTKCHLISKVAETELSND